MDVAVDNNTFVLEACYPNGATLTVKDHPGASTVTGIIRTPTLFNYGMTA